MNVDNFRGVLDDHVNGKIQGERGGKLFLLLQEKDVLQVSSSKRARENLLSWVGLYT